MTQEAFSVPIERLFPPPAPVLVEPPPAPADDTRLFVPDDGFLRPRPLAHGPFDALHGGAIGGLLANAAEALAAEHALGTPIGAHIQFLRPLKPDHRLSVTAEIAQPGRRLTLVDAFIEADDGLRAEARFTFARDVAPIAGLSPLPEAPLHDPASLAPMEAPHRPPRVWFKDALDWHPAPDGTMWM
ncbi:MAG: thioesterase family protein, partial [Zavarzinia sp.]|nr:thioesterase family protein [Zavarzinia sp.]